tara:strand:+ start:161 stop:1495 length:1335 start_codon:yes stop_codon:yes gene_type:complete
MGISTSRISVTNISVPQGASRVRKTTRRTYTATQLTGPTGSPPEYQTSIIRYDNAQGDNPVVIGIRNNDTNQIDWNDNATSDQIRNGDRIARTSSNQVNDIQRDLTLQDAIGQLPISTVIALNQARGILNRARNAGTDSSTPAYTPPSPTQGRAGTRTNFNSGAPNGGPPIVYPITLRKNEQDYIKFDMLKYEPSGFDPIQGSNLAGVGQRSAVGNRNSIGTVILPIPGGIADANGVSWSEATMNPMEAAMAGAAMNVINEGGKGAEKAVSGIKEAFQQGGPELKRAVGASFAGQAAGVEGVLTRATGDVLNPNMELLFKAPTLRPFNFTFKMAPRSRAEAQTVIAILRFFKQGMAVQRSASNLFLKSPNTWRIGYFHRNEEHRFLNKFKECALQNFSVEYTPDGNYSTYEDGVMTSYQMTMQFSELEPVFNDEYGDGFTNVGY